MRKRKYPLFLKIAIGAPFLILALYGVLCLAFPFVRYHLNHRKAPADLIEPQREITRMIKVSAVRPRSGSAVSRRHAIGAQTSATLAVCLKKYDFLTYRLTLDAETSGSALLLQIKRKLEPLEEDLSLKVFPDESAYYPLRDRSAITPWNPTCDSVTADQARWLETHHDLMDLIDQYCQTDGPTPPSIEECLQYEMSHPELIYPDTYLFALRASPGHLLSVCALLLSAAGKWALQQGDTIQAQHDYLELFKLWPDVGLARLQQWIETEPRPFANPQTIRDLLDATKQAKMTREAYTQPLINEFMLERILGLHNIERPFEPETWGWHKEQLYLLSLGPIKIPGPFSFELMYKMIRIPHRIKMLDRQWREGLAIMQLPWPEVPKETPVEHYDVYDDPYGPEMGNTFRNRLQSNLMLETRLNLVRAALTLQQEAQFKVPGRDFVFKNDPHNPWRDPFTERPFHVIESTTGTLIYSLGPDMQDQRGKPFDKTMQEQTGYADEHYDIVICVPRMRTERKESQ